MMRQVTIDQILIDIMEKNLQKKPAKRPGKKETSIHTWIYTRFAIVKVDLNATSDQLPQNLLHLSKIYLGEFPFIHLYICSSVMSLEAAERVSDSLASTHYARESLVAWGLKYGLGGLKRAGKA